MKSEFDLQNFGMRAVSSLWIFFFFQSWPLFRRRLASLRGRLYKRGIFRRVFLKVDERESGELFGELFWNDVAYFFLMINFCNLSVERRRNGNDIFYLRNCCRTQIFLRFQLRLFRDGGNEFFPEFSFFSVDDACVDRTDRSLSSFRREKCNFKSMSRFAVVEFEEIDATFS